MNQEFQESVIQLADTLDLDEIHSARLLLESQKNAAFLERSDIVSGVVLFHERRQLVLECLRLLLKQSTNLECEEFVQDASRDIVAIILETKDGPARNGSLFVQKCMDAMVAIEQWLRLLGERQQGALILDQTMSDEYTQMIRFQQRSLTQQHEALGAVIYHSIKAKKTWVEDFYKLLDHLPKLERWNNLAVHYVPIITAFTSQLGSPDGGGSLRDARMLNGRILDKKDTNPWTLRNLQAATVTWWLAEYSGWYLEQPTGSPVQGVNLVEEAEDRSESFFHALRNGGFECTLAICSQVIPDEWHDPAKHALIQLLLQDSLPLAQDMAWTSSYFQVILMEQFEMFTDAFITNMPDTLRRFKFEEDDQRKRFRTNLQQGAPNSIPEQILHLERFLVIISFAFDHRIEAAQAFWNDVDSNLYGFLQWASRRQSTPCVSAFCEMFRSISTGEECAASAHRFLLEEASSVPAKIRRTYSLSWAQIFGELSVYTAKLREQPTAHRPTIQYGGRPGPDDIDEPESTIMLESYLRLMAHLCHESAEIRLWTLSQTDFPVLEVLFYLCNVDVSTSLQACAFTIVQALLTNKSLELSMTVWTTLDMWVSGALSPAPTASRPPKAGPAIRHEQITFDAISANFEKANEFIALLHSLMSPAFQDTGLNDQLPFPETLGSTYRMSGIAPYIDLVFDSIFVQKKMQFDDRLQEIVLTWNVLRFAMVCLGIFNEDLVILANKSALPVDEAMNASSLLTYVSLHPFARVMEWMFNERVLSAVFASVHHDIDEVAGASHDSPLISCILCGINVMNLIVDLQSTYLDIVRPLVKLQSTGRKQPVLSPSLASFEDSVSLHLYLISDLGLYAGVGNQELTISSLKLLEKLASSKRLNVQSIPGVNQRFSGNRLIAVVEQNGNLASIANSLTLAMQFSTRELSQGGDTPGWIMKSVILQFLVSCLLSSPDRPTLAHALLGFACTTTGVDVDETGSFAQGQALFHAVLHLVIEYPDGNEERMESWSLDLKQKGMQVLSILWNSPLTSIFTLSEMRLVDSAVLLSTRQSQVGPKTLWDGRSILDPELIYTQSGEALTQFLRQRCLFFEYTSIEMRLIAAEGVPSIKERIYAVLFRSSLAIDGEQIQNMTVFDLLDFLELDVSKPYAWPTSKYFEGLNFSISTEVDSNNTPRLSDIKIAHEMIVLRLNDLKRTGQLQSLAEQQRADAEAKHILIYLQGENNRINMTAARLETLKAWTDLLMLAVATLDFGDGDKVMFILQALQLVTPRLEQSAMESVQETKAIAQLILALLIQLDFGSSMLDQSRTGDVANDRLFQVFRVALRAINCPDTDMQLREVLYQICYRYLSGTAQVSGVPNRGQNSIQIIKTSGEKTVDIICDDAYGASGICRISALLLLDSLVSLATSNKSNHLVDTLAKTNFVQVLTESIENLSQELHGTHAKGRLSPVISTKPDLTISSL